MFFERKNNIYIGVEFYTTKCKPQNLSVVYCKKQLIFKCDWRSLRTALALNDSPELLQARFL